METFLARYLRVYEALFVATIAVRFGILYSFFAHQPLPLAEVYQLPFTVASYFTLGIDALTMVILVLSALWPTARG